MDNAYVIARIRQKERKIEIADTNLIGYQYSANNYIELELDKSNDSPFKNMLITAAIRIGNAKEIVTCPLVEEDEKTYITLHQKVFETDGMKFLSIGGINENKIIITSNMLQIDVLESNPIIASVTPTEDYWQIEVKNAIDHWYATLIKPDLDSRQERVEQLINEAKNQQDTVTSQQSALDVVIKLVQSKITNGDFVPKHKWVGDVLYFSKEDGTWDEGFKVPGLNALLWKEATCIENATYQANIENWGTTENSLLAITFNTALDNTKEVILKINDEPAYPILSNKAPILGGELENKSTILRFDGTNWLVQTSQSGTVQSSDKSVKDIVTVTKEELKQLQEEGELVEGTLYQTVENPIDVTPLEIEILELEERTTVLENTTMKITDIESGEGYTKFPDGTLICHGLITKQCNISTPWGSGFYANVQDLATFPISFTSIPSCTITTSGTYVAAVVNSIATTEKITELTVFRPEAANNEFKFSYMAIGRWK